MSSKCQKQFRNLCTAKERKKERSEQQANQEEEGKKTEYRMAKYMKTESAKRTCTRIGNDAHKATIGQEVATTEATGEPNERTHNCATYYAC